jgi:hypothetical protein
MTNLTHRVKVGQTVDLIPFDVAIGREWTLSNSQPEAVRR